MVSGCRQAVALCQSLRSWNAVAWELLAKSKIWTTPQASSPTVNASSASPLMVFIGSVSGGVSPLGRCPKGRGVPSAAEQQAPPLRNSAPITRSEGCILFIIHYSVFSLQFSVYHVNEIYRKGFGISQASSPTVNASFAPLFTEIFTNASGRCKHRPLRNSAPIFRSEYNFSLFSFQSSIFSLSCK